MTQQASSGDPRRSMELLWGVAKGPSRGPRPKFDLPTIVAAAVELVDADGLDALSMRKMAERLGTSPMSLYTYVPGKAELVDLMLDAVLAELVIDHPLDDGWRAAVEASAREGWAFYQRHPWVVQVAGSRPILSPSEFDAYECQLRLFDGLGLTGLEMSRSASVVGSFVRGSAKTVADARAAEQATGVSDDDWWNARSPLLEELAGDAWADRYPLLSRLDAEQVYDQVDRPDDTTPYLVQDALDTFEFGLQRLLDGLEAYIASRAGT